MVWVLSFLQRLCESKLWTQQFYHNTVAFIAEKRSFHPFSCTPDSSPRRELSLRRPWPPCRQRNEGEKTVMHSHDLISVSVGEIRPNGQGNLSIILQTAAGEILPAYSAGAHIDIIIPGVGPRQYSLCGTPDRSNTYEICVRLTDTSTGGSRYLHQQLKAGDRLAISPPRNHFPLPQAGRYLLFAGGIGITPLLAMAEAIAARKRALELHYYVASSRQTAFSPRLNQLTANGTVAIHCSEEGASLRQRVPRCLTVPHPDTVVIACGPEGFIQRLRSVMEEYRWSPSQFVFERFTPAAENNTAAKNAFYIELASSQAAPAGGPDQTLLRYYSTPGWRSCSPANRECAAPVLPGSSTGSPSTGTAC